MTGQNKTSVLCARLSLACAAPFILLWIPVILRIRLPNLLELFFLFGGIVLTPIGALLAVSALWRTQGKYSPAIAGLIANGLIFIGHLAVFGGGFYTA